MAQYKQQLHPDLPKPTKLWGYADITNTDKTKRPPDYKYLGGVIVGQTNRPVRIDFVNTLPPKHILPVDKTIPGAETGQAENRVAVHLHGGEVPWTSDGGPFSWFTPQYGNFTHGPDWQAGDYWYPNGQSARLVWYHDHAFGITRINAYAGLASAYVITDTVEANLIASNVIPSTRVPLVLQTKTFKTVSDQWGDPGDLWYPSVYEDAAAPDGKGRWDRGGNNILPLPYPSAVPEFYADTAMVNGACYPYLNVQPRRYRFQFLNGDQARVYNLQLYFADGTGKEANLAEPGPAFIQIGTEGGFLPAPVVLNNPPVQTQYDINGNAIFNDPSKYNLLLGGAERADVIVDFSDCDPGDILMLYSDTPAPFPGGDPRNDYYTGNPDLTGIGGAPSTLPGHGPNTRTLMQIRVVALTGSPDPYDFASNLPLLNTALPIAFADTQPALLATPAQIGTFVSGGLGKTLNEDFDKYGRLIQRIGTTTLNGTNNEGNPTYARDYLLMPATETASQGETQKWNIYNLTGDTHPIHFHLVNVQIISRTPFDTATLALTGASRPPDDNEKGWKDTVRMNPGEVTQVIMKFVAPAPPSWIKMKTSPRTGGYEYVWHCHILEHEEHDMMRPLVITP
jgi:spore coat protein A